MNNTAVKISQSALKLAQPTVCQATETFLELGLLGKKPGTQDWYRKRLVPMANHLGTDLPIGSVMDADLLEWYARLSTKRHKWGGGSSHPQAEGGLSVSYLHGQVRAAKKLFQWLAEKKVISEDPSVTLNLPRLPKTGRKGIADKDAAKILELGKKGLGDGCQVRDFALLRVLESTGARLGGLSNLLLSDLNLDLEEPHCRRLTVREKGDKERTVVMTPGAEEALLAWLAVRPDIDDDHVFLGKPRGKNVKKEKWTALTNNGIYEIVKRYAEEAGVKKNWSPHQWRHRFGRKLAERGMSLGNIAQLMGHENVQITVKFYGIFSTAELQSSYDQYMPDFE